MLKFSYQAGSCAAILSLASLCASAQSTGTAPAAIDTVDTIHASQTMQESQAIQTIQPIQTIDKEIVAASRGQARVEAMPLHTTIVTREDIDRSPATTLDQLLRETPGLNFTGIPAPQSDPTGHQTRMRGLGNAKVLVLLDGIPIHDPFYLTTQWYKVPLSGVERIEIVRGGNSSLWGNMAVAGVINIVSRRPTQSGAEAAVSYGSRGTNDVNARLTGRVSDALMLVLDADRLDSRGYRLVPDEWMWRFPDRRPVDALDTSVKLSAFFKPLPGMSGFVRAGYSIQDQDIAYLYGSNKQKSPDIAGSVTQSMAGGRSVTASAWAQYVNFEKYNGTTCYWQAGLAAAQRCPSANNTTLTQVNDQVVQYYTQYGSQRYREQGASLIGSQSMDGWWRSAQVGVDFRRLSAKDNEFFYSAPQVLTQLQRFNSSTYGEAEQTFVGVFAQTLFQPIEPLEITLSARHDRWSNTGRINSRSIADGTSSGGPQPDNRKSAVDPAIAARYAVNESVAFRGAAYKSFRAPGFNNTTRTFGTNPTIANPDLEPEDLKGWEAGVDLRRGPISASATYFVYNISNQIATFNITGANYAAAPPLVQVICGAAMVNCGGLATGSASFYTNDQDSRSKGWELTLRADLTPRLRLDAWYTRTESVLTRVGPVLSNVALGVQATALPKNAAQMSVSWMPFDRARLAVDVRYIGRMLIDTTSGFATGTYYDQGSATVVNATGSWAVDDRVELRASVANLFNRTYSENAYVFNQPWNRTLSAPLTVMVGARVRL